MSTLRHQLPDEDQQTLNVYCAPYARTSAFTPFLRSLEARCGFATDDGLEARRSKLQALLEAVLNDPPAEALEILASLLSLPATVRLSPQRQRDEATQIFADLALRGAAERPMLLMV